MSRRTIIKGALILTIAGIITRVLGFFYRVYMAKTIGAEGMGLYQLITPLYMLVWALSSSGFSTAMSKLTAQEKARGAEGNVKRLLHMSLGLSTLIAVVSSFITYFYADEISLYIVKDSRTALSLRIISLCFPCMAMGSVMRGYYLGLQNTIVSAVSQVLEQTVRMAVIFLLSAALIPKGLEYACAAAVWGMAAGEIISFCYVFFYYAVKRKRTPPPILEIKGSMAMIMAAAVPLTLNRVTGSLFSTAENILIPERLQLFGCTRAEALSILGRLSGMAMPLVMFPSSLLTALATATMPVISESHALKQYGRIKSAIHQSMVITSIIGAFTSGIFIFFPEEVGILIYSQKQIYEILRLLGIICPFLYIQVTMSGILNGLGQQLFIFEINLFSSAVNLVAIYFIVPYYGIRGFLMPWILTTGAITSATIIRVNKLLNIDIPVFTQYIKPGLAVIFACLGARLCQDRLWYGISYKYGVMLTLLTAGVLYTYLVFKLKCISKEDLRM